MFAGRRNGKWGELQVNRAEGGTSDGDTSNGGTSDGGHGGTSFERDSARVSRAVFLALRPTLRNPPRTPLRDRLRQLPNFQQPVVGAGCEQPRIGKTTLLGRLLPRHRPRFAAFVDGEAPAADREEEAAADRFFAAADSISAAVA